MRGLIGLTVVKLGGSYAFSTHLKDWIDAIALCAGRVVVAPGGGPFADAVREVQPKMGLDDRVAHHMALLAMDQYGCALASLERKLIPAASATAIRRVLLDGGVPVWSATRMVLGAEDIPWSWDVTSDSLAAWLAGDPTRAGDASTRAHLLIRLAGAQCQCGDEAGADSLREALAIAREVFQSVRARLPADVAG